MEILSLDIRQLTRTIRVRFAPTFRHTGEWQWHTSSEWQLRPEKSALIHRMLAEYNRRSTAFNRRVTVWNDRGVSEYLEYLRMSLQGTDTTLPRHHWVSFRAQLGSEFLELRSAYDDLENVIRGNLKSRDSIAAMLALRSHVGVIDTILNRTWQSVLDGHMEMLRVDPIVEPDFVQRPAG